MMTQKTTTKNNSESLLLVALEFFQMTKDMNGMGLLGADGVFRGNNRSPLKCWILAANCI